MTTSDKSNTYAAYASYAMSAPVFETHAHYLFPLSVKDTAELFREEIEEVRAERIAFLSIPLEYNADGTQKLDLLQNAKGMFLKLFFSPNAYCLAGLVHPADDSDTERVANDFLEQVRAYRRAGFDGMKMLEGYPTFLKFTGVPLDSPVYDKFYAYCAETGFPVTMHAANPDESWDPDTTDQALIRMGRVYDGSYPAKEEILGQVFRVMEKHPALRLTLAHFGFFSKHYADAERFLSYPNTKLDLTPGGEQFLNMRENWTAWRGFFDRYADRLMYGTDFYAYPRNDRESWLRTVNLRPHFLRQFLGTDTEHEYLGGTFTGVGLPDELLEKLYRTTALAHYGDPKPADRAWLSAELDRRSAAADEKQAEDIRYMREMLNL